MNPPELLDISSGKGVTLPYRHNPDRLLQNSTFWPEEDLNSILQHDHTERPVPKPPIQAELAHEFPISEDREPTDEAVQSLFTDPPQEAPVFMDLDSIAGTKRPYISLYPGEWHESSAKRPRTFFTSLQYSRSFFTFRFFLANSISTALIIAASPQLRVTDLPLEPRNYWQAVCHKYKEQWLEAMQVEFDKGVSIGTFE
jgi:hypothetical protein